MDGEITPDELRSLLDGEGTAPRVVDIREPGAFERGHIPGSENVPMSALTDRIEEFDGADRVVTVCPHGVASVQVARLVASYEGVDGPVESLAGGLEAWDGPLEADDAGTDAADEVEPGGESAPF